MKKLSYLGLIVCVLGAASSAAFAGEDRGKDYPKMDKAMMMKKAGMFSMPAWKPMMMETKDGSIVVLAGSKLFKYDRNLNLVKEAEINIDFGARKKTMMPYMMKKKMMREKMMKPQPSESEE